MGGIKPTSSRTYRGFILLSILFWCGTLHVYGMNNGGSGLELPMNIGAWLYACGVLLIIGASGGGRNWALTRPALLFSGGAALLVLLCLLTPAVWRGVAMMRAAGIAGGLLFYLMLFRLPLEGRGRRTVLTILWLAVNIECLAFLAQYLRLATSLWEFPWWRYARPYGIFQQVNVMADFAACGALLSMLLFFRREPWLRRGIIATLLLQGFVIGECQSQTGYLGVAVGWGLLLLVFPGRRRQLTGLLLLLSGGVLIGVLVRHLFMLPFVDHGESVYTRWVVLVNAWRMFLLNPWRGWGVGSFGWHYLRLFGGEFVTTMSHPHNEILLWMVEGGVAGLAAAAMMLSGGLLLWLKGNAWRRATLVTALPVVIHLLTEYPLYLSTPHWLLLLTVLRCADKSAGRRLAVNAIAKLASGATVLLALAAVPMLVNTLAVQHRLTRLERNMQQQRLTLPVPPAAWLLYDRYRFDASMGGLQRYQASGDARWLQQFSDWSGDAMRVHPDPNVAFVRVRIAFAAGDRTAAQRLLRTFAWYYPHDERLSWLRQRLAHLNPTQHQEKP
jgi:O-antigen polymerase